MSYFQYGVLSLLADEMEQADEELRQTIQKIWPLQAKKMLDLLIPRREGDYMMLGFASLGPFLLNTSIISSLAFQSLEGIK